MLHSKDRINLIYSGWKKNVKYVITREILRKDMIEKGILFSENFARNVTIKK